MSTVGLQMLMRAGHGRHLQFEWAGLVALVQMLEERHVPASDKATCACDSANNISELHGQWNTNATYL